MSKSTESLGECPLNHWWFTGWAANTKKPDSLTWRPITCARHMSNKWCWAAACWLHAHFKVLDQRCNRGSSLKPHFTRPCTLGLRGTIVPCDEWFSFITWIYVLKKLFHNVTKLSILWQIKNMMYEWRRQCFQMYVLFSYSVRWKPGKLPLNRTIKVLSHYGLRTRFWQFVRTWFCWMTHSQHVDITTEDEPVKSLL